MSSLDKGLDVRKSASEMVEAYQEALKLAANGLALLAQAEDTLLNAYGDRSDFCAMERNMSGWYGANRVQDYFKKMVKRLRRGCWRAILDQMQVSKVASNKRRDQLYKHLENDELPEITLAAIYDQLDAFMQNSQEMAKESFLAAFQTLRPGHYYNKGYITNEKSEERGIGHKVIMPYKVRINYSRSGFQVEYNRRDEIIEVDRVFHLLDGREFAAGGSYHSPLVDAIEVSPDGKGSTEYFTFQCYGNGNLHLTFRRPDLVAMLNQVCSDGVSLKSGKFAKQEAFV